MTTDSATPVLRFSVALEPSHLLRARERLRDYLRLNCADEDLVADVVLCLEEACTNAIRHSGSGDKMQVMLRFEGDELHCRVSDHGKGFDITAFDPAAEPDLLASGGRGLYLIAQLMDDMTLRLDGGLEVQMRKRGVPLCQVQSLESGLGDLRAASELDYRDSRARAMLEEIDEAFVALDWEYRYVHVNKAMLRLTQTSREELLGRVIWELFPQLEGTSVPERFARAMELGIPSVFEHRAVVTGDWLEIRVYPTSVGISAYYRVINQRKREELERDELLAALREGEERYRDLVENANSAIMRWSADGTITFMNDYAQRLFGWSAQEAIGQPVMVLMPERDSTGVDLRDLAKDILAHPEEHANNVNENVCRDGRRLWMTWTNRAIRDEQGKVAEILAVGNDVTESRLREQALRESERRLRIATSATTWASRTTTCAREW